MKRLRILGLQRFWQGFREFTGDAAYERYLRERTHCPHHPPLGRREFYAQREQRRWTGIQRCC
jgi:uncharacterized short protein YbdD (DUF466 family)